jgi:hypothetical protein
MGVWKNLWAMPIQMRKVKIRNKTRSEKERSTQGFLKWKKGKERKDNREKTANRDGDEAGKKGKEGDEGRWKDAEQGDDNKGETHETVRGDREEFKDFVGYCYWSLELLPNDIKSIES